MRGRITGNVRDVELAVKALNKWIRNKDRELESTEDSLKTSAVNSRGRYAVKNCRPYIHKGVTGIYFVRPGRLSSGFVA